MEIVDSTRIRSAGATIKQQALDFEALYNEIKNCIRNMTGHGKGSSAEIFYNHFNQLSPSFDAYKLALNEYGDFLVASAGQFETTEAKIGRDQHTEDRKEAKPPRTLFQKGYSMPAANFKVTPELLIQTANQVEALRARYYSIYMKVLGEANTLNPFFKGRAHDAFVRRLQAFENDFRLMEELLFTYVTFLKESARKYDTVDETVAAEANKLKIVPLRTKGFKSGQGK